MVGDSVRLMGRARVKVRVRVRAKDHVTVMFCVSFSVSIR